MKKVCVLFLICCIFGGTAYAKNVYYKKYTDSTSGRNVEYFDFDGQNVERLYFTQNYWLANSDAFVVSCIPETKMYKYDIASHTVEALHEDDIKCNDVGITKDNIMYMRPSASTESERKIYSLDLNPKSSSTEPSTDEPVVEEPTTSEIFAEVNDSGTGFDGELIHRRWYDLSKWNNFYSYDRMIIFSGETGKSPIGGKHYSYNEEYTNYTQSGYSYRRWRNSWYFDIPNTFLNGTNYDTVEIEIEYYSTAARTLSLFIHSDSTRYQQSLVANKWTTAKFTITKNDGNNATFTDGYFDKYMNTPSNFRFATEGGTANAGCQIYVHKVTVRKINDNSSSTNTGTGTSSPATNTYNLKCLGDRPWGYQIHTTTDGKFLTITGDSGNDEICIYDIENNKWETISKKFPSPNTVANHVMINPVYHNLILFAHEGTATQVFDRMWIYDTDTKQYTNVFKQYNNIVNQYTGEAVGHESWSYDGESIVAVKYKEPYNVGKSGIIRVNKYGGEREYLNDDYDYWHCRPSPDGRWIVADTKLVNSKTKIVLIDSKTGKSYIVAEPQAGVSDPWQPHPQFSPDGKKVTFSMIYRQLNGTNVLGVGMVDVSDLVNDSQYVDTNYIYTNEKTGFRVSPFKININDNTPNDVTVQIENLDGKSKKISLYTAVYDNNGRLVSLTTSECNTANDKTLTTNFELVDNVGNIKCFLWDEEFNPIKTSITSVEKLRAAKIGVNNVVLTWQSSNNLIDCSYEIYRNGTKIGETSDLVYRDYNLTKGTQYSYEVKPIYRDNIYVTADDSCVSVTPIYSNKEWSLPSGNVSGPVAGVKLKTNSSTTSDKSSPYQFVFWDASSSSGLSYIGGGSIVNKNAYLSNSSSWLKFDVDDSYQSSSDMNMAWIDISYLDTGSSEIYLEYNTSDPTSTSSTKSHKRSESVIKCTNTGKVITKQIPLIDVDFSGYDGYDFRIGTNSKAYINKVRVLGY